MINNEIIKLKFDNSFNGRLFAVQGDTGRVFNLQVFDDFSKPVDVTGMKLRMYVANSKEVSYSEGEIVEAAEGKIKVQVYNSQLKYPGKQKAQFIITDKDGQKIGSKIFDLWIEEGLEAGPTVGRNIYVDFEKINEALDLIKDYDKTLEEAKEVDASLKVGINEGIEARNNLADCKKKALEIKDQLDKSKVDANKTLDDLKTTKTESETLKSDLSLENQKATENFNGLNTKIEEGKTTTSELNTNIENAKTNKENLDKSNTTALATKKSLEDATDAANTTKTELGSLKNQGDTLSEDLASKITEGKSLKSNLDTNISNAKNVKSNLDSSVATADSTNTTLKATDTEAKKTEALIKDLMSQLGKSENEVKQIIASGDLSKYITEPKLQEALKSYATKEDLQGIDVTGQLGDYAKKTDVPTKLSELQSDTNNRTVTDAEKNKLENIEDGAEKNKITSVNQKTGDVVLKISDLENDKNFKTEVEIQELINNSTKLKKEVVTSLPSTGKEDIIYLLKNKNDNNNFYTEYLWIGGKWEIIGDTKVDLTDYAKKTEIRTKLSEMVGDSKHRTLTDAEKEKWNKKFDLPAGKENQVLTKTTDGAEFKEVSSSRSATFVIANYDSSENSKAGADYVVQENDCAAEIISNFITKLPEYGGKIQLTEGNFNIKKNESIDLNKNNIIIEGYGNSTNIIDKLTKDERNHPIVFISNGTVNCRLSDLNITHEGSNSINIMGNKNYIKNVNVINNGTYPSVYFSDNTRENVLENCSVKCDLSNSYFISSTSESNKILNCSATSTGSYAFNISGSNNKLLNCSATSKTIVFNISGSNHQLSNCSGTSTGNSVFFVESSNHQLSNCSGTSTDSAGFTTIGSNHQLSNCSGTSTNYYGISITGSGISLTGSRGKSSNPNKGGIYLDYNSKSCIVLGNHYNTEIKNSGTNNVIANNIKLE